MDRRIEHHEGGIRAWALDEQPRERILRFGCGVLSNAELIGSILGAGFRSKLGPVSAVEIGRMLLRRHDTLRDLAATEAADLLGLPGIGKAQSAKLAAAFELGKRIAQTPDRKSIVINGPADVARHFGPTMRDLHREVFKVVMLNSAGRVIRTFTASEGGLAASIVEPRLVFRRAILAHAASIVCLHNHPSGNLEPSKEDVQITRQLVGAGKVVGISLKDHVIIAGDGYTSMAERGLLEVGHTNSS